MYDLQHDFRERRSCETQLTMPIEDLARNGSVSKQTDIILLDFLNLIHDYSDTEAAVLDLHLSISNDIDSTRIYDKRDDFDFEIVNFPF